MVFVREPFLSNVFRIFTGGGADLLAYISIALAEAWAGSPRQRQDFMQDKYLSVAMGTTAAAYNRQIGFFGQGLGSHGRNAFEQYRAGAGGNHIESILDQLAGLLDRSRLDDLV